MNATMTDMKRQQAGTAMHQNRNIVDFDLDYDNLPLKAN